jgi:heat shock protein HslJ
MYRVLNAAALLCLAACSGQDAGSAPAQEAGEASSNTSVEAEAIPSLEGEWRVAAIDGKPVGQDSAMTASFASGKVNISSGCLRRAWTYTQKRNIVAFAANPGGSSNCEGRGTTAEQETAYAALQEATMAIFGKDGNQASLSGTGGNLTLERR